MLLLFIYLFNLYIRPQDWLGKFQGIPVDYLTIAPALAYGLFIQSRERRKPLVQLPHYLLLAVSLVIIFLSNAVHDQVVFGALEFVKYLKLVCIFTMILLLPKSTAKLKWALFFIVLCSVFIAGQAISQFISGGLGFAGQDFYHSGEGIRTAWVGLWNGSNMTSLLLNCSIPFALEFAFGPYRKSWRLLNLIFTACLIGGVYTTNSRGGFLTLLAILFLYPFFRIRSKKLAIIAGILLAGAILVYLSPSRSNQIDTSEESAHIRTRLWNSGMEMFKDYPLLGVGKGKFAQNTSRNLIAHSNFMQNLGETGGIGIFVWVAIIYFTFKGLLYPFRIKPKNEREKHLNSLSRALLVSFLGFNIGTLFITMEIDLFYLLLGLCAACINIFNREVKPVKMMECNLGDIFSIFGILIGYLGFYHYYTR
jgi:putative inorganic carbon (hco3(-)) transporter